MQKGSSVVLEGVHQDTTVSLRWYDEDTDDTCALSANRITPVD